MKTDTSETIRCWKCLFLAFPCLLLCGCLDDLPAPKGKWTVLVYMNGKNDLAPFTVTNFEQMSRVADPSGNVKVVVEWGHRNWSHVYRVWVSNKMKISAEPSGSMKGVMDVGDQDMGDVKTLGSFVQWGKTNFPADRFMLVIWDHGQGYRLELSGGSTPPAGSFAMNIAGKSFMAVPAFPPAPGQQLPSYRSISSDQKTGHHLYNSDIQTVLEKARVDVLGFDACLMSMVETGYAVRRGSDIMIGSEELEPCDGWQYDLWLRQLSNAPLATAEQVAGMVVDSYRSYYSSRNVGLQVTLSAARLGEITNLATVCSELANALIGVMADTNRLSEVVTARQACREFDAHYVDLSQFAGWLNQNSRDGTIQAAAKKVKSTVSNCVSTNWSEASSCSGLSIYFPSSGGAYARDQSNKDLLNGYEKSNTNHPVEFVAAPNIHWTEFLHEYFKRVP